MKSTTMSSVQLLTDSYRKYQYLIFLYIYDKIGNKEEAEDLAQDVFLRLAAYNRRICPNTIKSFIFTIAHNLVNDFLRRHYKYQEVIFYMYDHMGTYTNETESHIIANDLQACERNRLRLLPEMRRTIYALSRYEEKTSLEISRELNLSPRTVENHLFIGRHEMRAYMRKCI